MAIKESIREEMTPEMMAYLDSSLDSINQGAKKFGFEVTDIQFKTIKQDGVILTKSETKTWVCAGVAGDYNCQCTHLPG